VEKISDDETKKNIKNRNEKNQANLGKLPNP
jgi:hypothetical protein